MGTDYHSGIPEKAALKPQMGYFTDVVHGIEAGDSGYFITLCFMKFRNDGLGVGGCVLLTGAVKQKCPREVGTDDRNLVKRRL